MKTLLVILVAIGLAWFAIWQGIEFAEYQWQYSHSTPIRAWQDLLYYIWGMFTCTSPAWWLGGIILTVKQVT